MRKECSREVSGGELQTLTTRIATRGGEDERLGL